MIEEASLGKSHPKYANTISSIGGVYRKIGRYAEALKVYEECRVIEEATLGKSHPDYAITL